MHFTRQYSKNCEPIFYRSGQKVGRRATLIEKGKAKIIWTWKTVGTLENFHWPVFSHLNNIWYVSFQRQNVLAGGIPPVLFLYN